MCQDGGSEARATPPVAPNTAPPKPHPTPTPALSMRASVRASSGDPHRITCRHRSTRRRRSTRCSTRRSKQSAQLDRHVPSAGAQIEPGAESHGMQSTGRVAELVEMSEGGLAAFGGAMQHHPLRAVFSGGCLRRPSGGACGGLLFVWVWCGRVVSLRSNHGAL